MRAKYLQNRGSVLFWTTVVVGILDAVAAMTVYYVFFNLKPMQVYQYVASGIMGKTAYDGGAASAWVGVGLHIIIAFAATYIFFILSPRLKWIRENVIVAGMLYGLLIWVVMNLIIVPLSLIEPAEFNPVDLVVVIWHMTVVGLPISLLINKYYENT
ncbi:hypothetical protein GCM10022246_17710 [Pedobacter ginsengiterrae]|uniref:DUF1440 domain-containing protein n=1 Tax=Pedobacter ginsengiterrae TaxID=871696 RepID=A0ABP7PHF0_9SPHI